MHGSVLQNEDYIKFSEENTVEVLALGRLGEGIEKGDKKAATYDAEDAEGNPVKYMVEWPGLTAEDIEALNRSQAGQYNKTGKIPYTAIVDPHTQEQIKAMPGGSSSGQIMEAVEEAKKKLVEAHGPGLSRSYLRALDDCKIECDTILSEKGAGKALAQLSKDWKKIAKGGDAMVAKLEEYQKQLLAKAGDELDSAEVMIGEGDIKGAKKILSSLKSALKKTPLEERLDELEGKLKADSGK